MNTVPNWRKTTYPFTREERRLRIMDAMERNRKGLNTPIYGPLTPASKLEHKTTN